MNTTAQQLLTGIKADVVSLDAYVRFRMCELAATGSEVSGPL